jgi:hypothetical protein
MQACRGAANTGSFSLKDPVWSSLGVSLPVITRMVSCAFKQPAVHTPLRFKILKMLELWIKQFSP